MPTRTNAQPTSPSAAGPPRRPAGPLRPPGPVGAGPLLPQRAERPGPLQQAGLPSRRKPQQSGAQKALAALTGALPGLGSTKKRGGNGGGKRRAGGMALLAGGLGLALKNRDKLGGLMGRRQQTTPATGTTPPPSPMP